MKSANNLVSPVLVNVGAQQWNCERKDIFYQNLAYKYVELFTNDIEDKICLIIRQKTEKSWNRAVGALKYETCEIGDSISISFVSILVS